LRLPRSTQPRIIPCLSNVLLKFAELIEQDGIIPAPYVARYHWVALERFDALPQRELKELLKKAYQLVREKLPKKIQAQLK